MDLIIALGLNGIVIKSHGGTDAEGIAAAIDLAHTVARAGLREKIEADLANYHRRISEEAAIVPESSVS